MKPFLYTLLVVSIFYACHTSTSPEPTFSIHLPAELATASIDGRLLLLISTDEEEEPRFQINDSPATQQAFGMNVEGWAAGTSLQFDGTALGYPIEHMSDLPQGDYQVQVLLHKYETFTRSDGHTVKLPMDRGEGQQWNRAPGNLLSKPIPVTIEPGGHYELNLTDSIRAIAPPEDTEWVKHVKIKSKLLSDFWGRDMYLGAHVLLPKDWDKHPDVKYPLAVFHGHFPADFGDWRTVPVDTTEPCVYSNRFGVDCYNRIVQQEQYDFYQQWTSDDFPRMLIIEIQHANPFYDDSYAVNSENLGPYGDAITYELIPYIEEQFRGIGEGWARILYGGSTGGWEALAAQVLYPDDYGSCYAACPDPIDFRAFCLTNIYEDENAYYLKGGFRKQEIPGRRDYLGNVTSTLRFMNMRELVLGDKSRSGQQWDIWEAVYSPVGADGYPQRIWDKYTGDINRDVANYWRENYDLAYIMKRDWTTLGPKLTGKVHIYCGDMDNYYLNNAVYLAEEILEETTAPYYDGEVDYGDRAEHCWNGDPTRPNYLSRLRYNQMFIPKWVKEDLPKIAPRGADLASWRY